MGHSDGFLAHFPRGHKQTSRSDMSQVYTPVQLVKTAAPRSGSHTWLFQENTDSAAPPLLVAYLDSVLKVFVSPFGVGSTHVQLWASPTSCLVFPSSHLAVVSVVFASSLGLFSSVLLSSQKSGALGSLLCCECPMTTAASVTLGARTERGNATVVHFLLLEPQTLLLMEWFPLPQNCRDLQPPPATALPPQLPYTILWHWGMREWRKYVFIFF